MIEITGHVHTLEEIKADWAEQEAPEAVLKGQPSFFSTDETRYRVALDVVKIE